MQARPTRLELRQKPLVEERLKAIAAQLISAHRKGDHGVILRYAAQAGLTMEGLAPQRLFMKVIQVFHPDRFAGLWKQIEEAVHSGDEKALLAFAAQLELQPLGAPRTLPDSDTDDEDFGFDDEAFGFAAGPDPEDGTFYAAVRRVLFGNQEFYPGPEDLVRLEGELDLSAWDLHDLDGIEHCRNLSSLNLSRNHIDNVYPLKNLSKLTWLDLAENDLEDADWLGGLSNLTELDLSANDIDDVAFLDRLPRLKYVDLSGNPVRNKAVLERLEARGVIVIV